MRVVRLSPVFHPDRPDSKPGLATRLAPAGAAPWSSSLGGGLVVVGVVVGGLVVVVVVGGGLVVVVVVGGGLVVVVVGGLVVVVVGAAVVVVVVGAPATA